MTQPDDVIGWYDFSWSGGSFPVCFRPAGNFFCPKFQAPARWEIDGDTVKIDWKKFGKYELKFDAATKTMDGNAVPKTEDDKNWRKATFNRALSPVEVLLLGDGAGSEWDFEWSGGKFPVKFKGDGYNHFQCDDFPAHASSKAFSEMEDVFGLLSSSFWETLIRVPLHLGTKPQHTSFCMSFVPNSEHCHVVSGCFMSGLRPTATGVNLHTFHNAFLQVHRTSSSPVREGQGSRPTSWFFLARKPVLKAWTEPCPHAAGRGLSGRVTFLLGFLLCRARRTGQARTRCLSSVSRLEDQMEAFRAAVAPKPSDRLRRATLLSKLEKISKKLLGSDVQVLGYGSCFTGVGESDAEIDATVYIPMTPARAAELTTVAATRSRQMREIVKKCALLGLQTADNFGVRRGTACIEESASVHLSGNLWRTYSAARCILSCQRLMPLYSSHLVRAYLELDPRLQNLILALRHWARTAGIVGREVGLLSSYTLALMAIYSVQICDGLPSLHNLAKPDGEGIVSDDGFDTVFVPFQDVDKVGYKGLRGMSSGELLLNFFDFFAEKFDWNQEVVSVREASRQTIESPCFQNLWGRTKKAGLHVEDPIELGRNLNNTVSPDVVERFRALLIDTAGKARTNPDLAELICLDGRHWSLDGDKLKINWAEFGNYEMTVDASKSAMDGGQVGGDPSKDWRKFLRDGAAESSVFLKAELLQDLNCKYALLVARGAMTWALRVVARLVFLGLPIQAAYFNLHEGEEKCFVETVPQHQVLTVKYRHADNPGV
ncbi:cid13, partial [Symbiodinium necroappetens]